MAPEYEAAPATRTDVLVAGSGAAGLTAALAAAAGGARVVLAERSDEFGGTTALSFGRVWVPASHHAPSDRQEAARAYLTGLFSGRYPGLLEAFVAGAPEMARFVERHSPLRFVPCVNYPDYHPKRPGAARGGRALDIAPLRLGSLTTLARSVRTPPGYVPLTHAEWEEWRYPPRFDWALLDERTAQGILAGGTALAAALLDGAVRLGVRLLTGTRLTALRRCGGRVAVATVEHGGTARDIAASAVILATGGFDRDLELRARLLPAAVAATGAAPGNSGDGLRIAVEAGARLENTGQGWWMPMIEIPGQSVEGQQYYQSLIRERALPRQILVNDAGRRFADEALPYNELGKAMNRQNLDGVSPTRPPGWSSMRASGSGTPFRRHGRAARCPAGPCGPARWPGWPWPPGLPPGRSRKPLRGGTGTARLARTGSSAAARTSTSGSWATPMPSTRTSARSTSRPTMRSRCCPAPSAPRAARSPTMPAVSSLRMASR